jgi:hypothetical protein
MATTNYSYIGAGKIYLRNKSSGTAGLIQIGNATNLEFSVEEDKKELLDMRSGGGGLYNSLSRIQSVSASITASDFSPENLAIALRGTATAVTAAAVVDEVITVPTTLDVDSLVKTEFMIDTAVAPTVTSNPAGTTYTVNTDYTVTPAGIIVLAAGTIAGGASLLIDYTKDASSVVETLTVSAYEYEMLFDGLNDAQSGAPVTVVCHRVKFSPTAGLGMITEDFGELTFEADMLADSTITSAGLSQYMKITVSTL